MRLLGVIISQHPLMNPAEIIAYLDRLCVESGVKDLKLLASGSAKRYRDEANYIAYSTGVNTVIGETAELAIANYKAKVGTLAEQAATKRDLAQKLLLEAELLEREGDK